MIKVKLSRILEFTNSNFQINKECVVNIFYILMIRYNVTFKQVTAKL